MKTKNYIEILKLRKYLQALSQLSFSYSQINKNFSPLENQNEDNLKEMLEFYLGLLAEAKRVVSEYETETKGLDKSI